MQAGSNLGKSRASQTPYHNSAMHKTSSSDLSRTQSLPSEPREWLEALASVESCAEDFGDVAAEYSVQVRFCLSMT